MGAKETSKQCGIPRVLLSVLLAGGMSVGAAGCGNKTGEGIADTVPKAQETQAETENSEKIENGPQTQVEPEIADFTVEIEETTRFSEGLAWIKYEVDDGEDSTDWAGYIDKTGKLVFRYKYSASPDRFDTSGTDFENGHAYISSQKLGDGNSIVGLCWVVDKTGKVVSEFQNAVSWGGGYVVTADYNSSFDSTSYTYHIFSDDGTEVTSFESEGSYGEINYCGEGIFSFGDVSQRLSGNTYHEISFLYNAASNKRLDVEYTGSPWFNSKTKKSFYDCSSDDDFSYIRTINTDGAIEEYKISETDLDGHLDSVWLVGDICTVYVKYDSNLDARLFTYNISSGELHELDRRYADAASTYDYEYLDDVHASEDRCVIKMQGADGDSYIGIFDTALNPIVEPFKAYEHTSSGLGYSGGGRLILDASGSSSVDVYDLDGKLVYSADTLGSTDGYQDDLLLYNTGGQAYCRDLQGKIVFDDISGFDAPEIL